MAADSAVPDAAVADVAFPDVPVPDARVPDARVADARPSDGSPIDARPPDAAPPDARPPDAAPIDASPPDSGPPRTPCEEAALRPNNDTCAKAIQLEARPASAGGVTTYGSTVGYADNLNPDRACTSSISEDGPDAIYSISAINGQRITAKVTPSGVFDPAVYVVTNCSDDRTCVAGRDSEFAGEAETVVYVVPATGTYFLVIDAYFADETGCFTLNVSVD
ncbi:MAG: hypothetical protein HY698_01485 [Deltaproteobacteria bacterium]|nr:hypothetical protein [Deltaproteobacteria bacterium]